MNHLRLLAALLLLATFSSALADSPAKISEDYRKAAAATLAKLNDTLEKATVPLIAQLVKTGDTVGADALRDQLKAKIDGEPVAKPQDSATRLFEQYDQARAKALEPVQNAAIARIEALLSSSEGKKIEVVTELSKTRAEIAAGKAVSAAAAAAAAPSDIPLSWDYYVGTRLVGLLSLKGDGTLTLQNVNPDGTPYLKGNPKMPVITAGQWKKIKSSILKISFTTPGEEEECDMILSGKNAVLKRAVGDRSLTAR